MTSRPPLLRRLLASLVAGAVTALTSYAAVVLAFYLSAGAAPAQFASIALYFALSGLILLVLLTVAIVGGVVDAWYRLLLAGLAGGVLSAYIGTVGLYLRGGNPFAPSAGAAFGTLVASNLPFVIAATVAALTVARPVYSWVLRVGAKPTPAVHGIALVRSPASTLAKGEVTHVRRKKIDLELADTQWEAYVAALESEGFTTLEVEAADEHPDSVFIEDTVVILGQTAVITSPGAESRRGEPRAVEEVVADLGLTTEHIRLPGTLDGGDVLKIGSTVYIGRGGRTNAEGIRQFRAIASRLGYTVVAVPVTKALHLKSAVTALPDGTVLGFPPLLEHPELFHRFLAVPEETGVAVVVLSNNAVLMASSAPKSAALIADLGYRVVTVDIGEFEKLEGCVTCLSVRIR